ncbi:MAG: GTPase RsgA, partial [Deltaproteobacteria bacterium]|nr:GTPase RsgA [Deltaproteobacteria bacterium]
MTDLQAMGWGPFFEDQWSVLARKGWLPARIAAEHRGRFQAWTASGPAEARLAGRLQRELRGEARPAVGDWVALRPDGTLATVERVLARRSAFVRRAVGERDAGQVVAANVDTILLVLDLEEADLNMRRAERFLAQLMESGARPVLVLNKSDVRDDGPALLEQVRRQCPNAGSHLVSARCG